MMARKYISLNIQIGHLREMSLSIELARFPGVNLPAT